ncbi:hypothetical protein [Streptococcus anginosus]|uniref:hypothetical protein n=1 Tax=Streptococcus anginosus TaxID=1328 RepID=UPI00356730D9
MKKLSIIIGSIFVIIVSPFLVQYGWNEIITTIIPVSKISIWQALGLYALLTFIFPDFSNKKESADDYSGVLSSSVAKIISCAFLLALARLFI